MKWHAEFCAYIMLVSSEKVGHQFSKMQTCSTRLGLESRFAGLELAYQGLGHRLGLGHLKWSPCPSLGIVSSSVKCTIFSMYLAMVAFFCNEICSGCHIKHFHHWYF